MKAEILCVISLLMDGYASDADTYSLKRHFICLNLKHAIMYNISNNYLQYLKHMIILYSHYLSVSVCLPASLIICPAQRVYCWLAM